MDREKLLAEIVSLMKPYVKNQEALVSASTETSISRDLRVNSARMVDITLAIEDRFGIEVDQDDVEWIDSLGELTDLVSTKVAAASS